MKWKAKRVVRIAKGLVFSAHIEARDPAAHRTFTSPANLGSLL